MGPHYQPQGRLHIEQGLEDRPLIAAIQALA
jgi:hypothetical protein